ncbi:MAG: LPS assembly lipoprotein LptE [Alphaproteobacteria bacterium]|nr:LPS assembly lipoprotein LptE [Alphaproteobacteria bacterium]
MWLCSGNALRRANRWAVALTVGLMLTACGYRPLYAPQDPAAAPDMSTVKVRLIEDRSGQALRNLLLDRMNPNGEPANPEYELEVELTEDRRNLGLRKDETATRADLTVQANYELRKVGQADIVLVGRSRSVSSFNIVQSQFATLAAETDARKRALRELSDQIVLRVALHLNSRSGGT